MKSKQKFDITFSETQCMSNFARSHLERQHLCWHNHLEWTPKCKSAKFGLKKL